MDYLYLPLHELTDYLEPADKKRLYAAFCFSRNAHQGQFRQTGEYYITHPVAVACSLSKLSIDPDSLIAALLHDVIEDTQFNRHTIVSKFGKDVAQIVDGVSRLEGLAFKDVDAKQAANFSKMLLAMAKDSRVILIKLADRIHNIQSVDVFRRNKQYRIAKETLEIYAPLAAKMGLNAWRIFLENKSFEWLYPRRYEVLLKAMNKAKGDRKELIDKIEITLREQLTKDGIKVGQVKGREKRPYSVYHKMRKKNVRFQELMDLFAFRVLVDSINDCYRSLGILHRFFKPVPGRFKDYIALPKNNGYQSLHTVLINSDGIQAEFQIRTSQMHLTAEYGVASHWQYKSGMSNDMILSNKWLTNLLDLHQDNTNQQDLLESAKTDLFPVDEVFVFTPNGRLISLPIGATALDFAYAIHSKIGNHAVDCKINRRFVPLNQVLQNGDLVEIITSRHTYPATAWLDFVTTAKARAAIRNHLGKLQEKDLKLLGEDLFTLSLNENALKFKKIPKYARQSLLEELEVKSFEELFLAIGRGQRPARLVVSQLQEIMGGVGRNKNPKDKSTLTIQGTEGTALQFARCCYPIHGDNIIGHISGDRGIVVHRRECPNVRQMHKNPTQWVAIQWGKEKRLLPTSIQVVSCEVKGIFASIANTISAQHIDIKDVNVTRDLERFEAKFLLILSDRSMLAQLMKAIRKLPDVVRVSRLTG